jgi:hypothetical protein
VTPGFFKGHQHRARNGRLGKGVAEEHDNEPFCLAVVLKVATSSGDEKDNHGVDHHLTVGAGVLNAADQR